MSRSQMTDYQPTPQIFIPYSTSYFQNSLPMESNERMSGAFVRMLMINQNRSVPTRRQEVRANLKINSRDISPLIKSSQEYLSKIGLELVGIDKSGLVDPSTAERFFLRRLKRSKDAALPTEEFRRLVLAFTFINLEQRCVEVSKLWFLFGKMDIFKDECEFNEFIKLSKKQGYLTTVKNEEHLSVTFGWRYYCDFQSFDPRSYFQNSKQCRFSK